MTTGVPNQTLNHLALVFSRELEWLAEWTVKNKFARLGE